MTANPAPGAASSDVSEAAQFLAANLKEAVGNITADYGEVTGAGFQMMTMCPDPERLAAAINQLPTIASILACPSSSSAALVTQIAQFVREWNGETANGNTFFIADEIEKRFTTPPAPVEGVEEARDILSGLSSFLGAGIGDDGTTLAQFDARIRWGIDHIGRVYRGRAAQVVEECSKRPKTTWGQVKRAILDDTCLPTAQAPERTTQSTPTGEGSQRLAEMKGGE